MSQTKIPTENSRAISYFILYNHDNLIADFYEKKPIYQITLVNLLAESTSIDKENIKSILNNRSLNTITKPILYMKSINNTLKNKYSYTFL